MIEPTCRWGILGTANIARKNWQGIRDAGNATLVAVASREQGRAAKFVAECQQSAPLPREPEALGSYAALLSRPDIDAVYLPLPTGVRREWVLRAAAAGKHVLAEKPVGCSVAEVREMIAACAQHRRQFMDGVMFMHGERLRALQALRDDPERLGPVRHVASQFSFQGGEEFLRDYLKTYGEIEPLGCLGDLGWYCIRFSLWAASYAMPVSVTGFVTRSAGRTPGGDPVPLEFTGHLVFADGPSATFHCSFAAEHAQWAMVSGARGLLRVPDFVLPYSGDHNRFDLFRSEYVVEGCRFDMHERREETVIAGPSNNAPGSPEASQFRTFSAGVLAGSLDDRWPALALQTQQVLEACLQSARRGSVPVAPEAASD